MIALGVGPLVSLVRRAGISRGLYGAKITGGGSGGTVCVLGANTEVAAESFRKVVHEYEKRRGGEAYIVGGSSLGAVAFGHLDVPTLATATQATRPGRKRSGEDDVPGL